MPIFWTGTGSYRHIDYENEADFESAILQVQDHLFGPNRYYLDIKKKIGAKGATQNIPDGYLLDLSGTKPRLYVVENELQEHDPLRHIAVQILQFSLSFESDPLLVKKILIQALHEFPTAQKAAQVYAASKDFRNLDHLVEYLVAESPFAALVIIDSMSDELEAVLSDKFRFGVEVLELSRYENQKGERVYHFEPFLADLTGESVLDSTPFTRPALVPEDIDTVVVPAREDGFQETFIGENRWYQVRINGSIRSQIKYIAAYRIAPTSAITHIAPVKSIEPWKDTGKVVLNFSEPAKTIGPIPLLTGGQVRQLQSLRYTTRERLLNAKNLDEVFAQTSPAKSATAGI